MHSHTRRGLGHRDSGRCALGRGSFDLRTPRRPRLVAEAATAALQLVSPARLTAPAGMGLAGSAENDQSYKVISRKRSDRPSSA